MKYDELIFAQLISDDLLPETGLFEVNDKLLDEYVYLYSTFSDSGNLKTNSNRQYAKKLAALSFLKLNERRADDRKDYNKLSTGIVYLISNPAFPGYIKVGITKNLKKRLNSYQTYDPLRRFKVEHYFVAKNAKELEKFLLDHPAVANAKGEWVKDTVIRDIFLSSSVGRASDC